MDLFIEFEFGQCYTGTTNDTKEICKKEERKNVFILSETACLCKMHRMEEKIWKQRK